MKKIKIIKISAIWCGACLIADKAWHKLKENYDTIKNEFDNNEIPNLVTLNPNPIPNLAKYEMELKNNLKTQNEIIENNNLNNQELLISNFPPIEVNIDNNENYDKIGKYLKIYNGKEEISEKFLPNK